MSAGGRRAAKLKVILEKLLNLRFADNQDYEQNKKQMSYGSNIINERLIRYSADRAIVMCDITGMLVKRYNDAKKQDYIETDQPA